ncbi:6-phosphogluconate dehydrogenase, decarboxylating [Oceaniovalibus guishaninsula JLT2003]|uniref:6-phosphogluconate dehydrogenase, decarboxylating n=1 Tax=Oceaniovalibus guishaninsula JLT2003 TaxID=1231392 RepID=K2H865_9RHOB|nr:decarboxylating 6-phosphogluconate dehydrogenase [Oceaniovalibus guishaninsula]EKE43818.1 6-phosphogluconate dehydrogenase, decarboxylating [Oceaniovalibus guishaninsula JLT2003]
MKIGMIGLGRMGSNMARRLMEAGHDCVVHDRSDAAIASLVEDGAEGHGGVADFVAALPQPRTVWLMVPAGAVDETLGALAPHLESGDVVVDGGNSYYIDDLRRSAELKEKGITFLDCGTSGGVWGLDRGYCLMIGGDADAVSRLEPIFAALAPGEGEIVRTPGRPEGRGTAEKGYLHCGPSGAGHFVKMVHNGIEYGLMAAYAEGFAILKAANVGNKTDAPDAETTPLRNPEHYRYDMDLPEIAELWRRGSVISSWLLDLSATALIEDPGLAGFRGHVSDSGEGRWTIKAAIDEGMPVPVLSSALYERFSSRGQSDFADRLLSAMRHEFGGHLEKAVDESKQTVGRNDG